MIRIIINTGTDIRRSNDSKFGSHPVQKAKFAKSIINSIRSEFLSDRSIDREYSYDTNSVDFIDVLYYYGSVRLYNSGVKDLEYIFNINGIQSKIEDVFKDLSTDRYISSIIDGVIKD